MNPINLFQNWFAEESKSKKLKLPAACCLSTTGLDGYPNARFVSLKEILNEQFVITGSLDARKGKEIEASPKAALTFWWTSTERQVRIQGTVIQLSQVAAKTYFEKRNTDSKIVSTIFEQGKPIDSISSLRKGFEEYKLKYGNKEVDCPDSWGGIGISPIRMEFMQFKKSRLHERILYKWIDSEWISEILQP